MKMLGVVVFLGITIKRIKVEDFILVKLDLIRILDFDRTIMKVSDTFLSLLVNVKVKD